VRIVEELVKIWPNEVCDTTDEEKINFAMTYLSGIVQDWFEVALHQKNLGYAQPWLFTWHLFVEEL